MPLLDRTLPTARKTVGFELPVFRSQKRANSDLVQKIAPDGTVERFLPTVLDTRFASQIGDDEARVVEEGDPALWAYRNERFELLIGSEQEMRDYGLNALSNGELDGYPIAAAEMVAFCKSETQHRRILRLAYEHLGDISTASADSWRDATVLLPAIREDVAAQFGTRIPDILRQIVAVSNVNVTTIYGPAPLDVNTDRLPRFWELAGVFGIKDVRFVGLTTESRNRNEEWRLDGTGGVAAHVLSRRPFFGREEYSSELGKKRAVASGTSSSEPSSTKQLFVTTTGSDMSDVRRAHRELERSHMFRYRHAINLRPMGFGTPSTLKSSPEEILRSLPSVDVLWVLAGHRLRQTGRYQNGMSTLHMLSRTLSGTLSGLIESLRATGEGRNFLESLRAQGVLGAVGILRYNNDVDEVENIRRLIFNMLSEDVLLHTAEAIKIVWPVRNRAVPRVTHLGDRRYPVEFTEVPGSRLGATLVGFAPGVRAGRRTAEEFRDLCVSVTAAYGFEKTYSAERSFAVERHKETLLVFTPVTAEQIWSLVQDIEGGASSLIVTNKTLSANMKAEAKRRSVELVHYSELGRWLKLKYRARLLAERDHWGAIG
ncbi:hypothetical protein GCM10010520_51550 [Rhizobium viscosum]|uniref:Uncharacterized protein n=1 Tax=Rhizobium viscosum TaxID=1673 RepID=A0ABR9IZA6_RHIVS|nr:hypothetical protein [Rhizobium viscosum]MBE1508529.1 hypothetical protein [Rhizobium viscosum]